MTTKEVTKCEDDVKAETPRYVVFSPRTNIKETEDGYLVDAEMPGVSEKDVVVTVENNVLILAGERPADEGQCVRRRYERRLRLPNSVDSEKIEARMRYGVLSLTLPKSEAVKPRTIKVKGSK